MDKKYFLIDCYIEADEASHTAFKFIELNAYWQKIKDYLEFHWLKKYYHMLIIYTNLLT